MDRAVVTVERTLETQGAPVYVRKQIVHNIYVVRELEKRGAIFVDEADEVPVGATVVFSAHGVSPAVHAQAAARNLTTIDATCPLVTKVHSEARRFASDEHQIVLIGHAGHEEVEGTMGEAPAHMTLVESPEDVDSLTLDESRPISWLSQTTLSVTETLDTVHALRQRYPQLIDPPSDDICYATQNRQQAVRKIAPDCDVVIVVGSANSSNTVRLVDVALEYGAAHAYRVDAADEIEQQWLDGATCVGVTSGASVPEILVEGVINRLAQSGFDHVDEVQIAQETLSFALPPELRRAMKSAGKSGE